MRRIVCLLIVLAVTATLLGCGSDKDRGKYHNEDKPKAADKE